MHPDDANLKDEGHRPQTTLDRLMQHHAGRISAQAENRAYMDQFDVTDYGNGFKSSSLRKVLCLSFAAAIAFSISINSWKVSSRTISDSFTTVLI